VKKKSKIPEKRILLSENPKKNRDSNTNIRSNIGTSDTRAISCLKETSASSNLGTRTLNK
jgi:hypothetical protein